MSLHFERHRIPSHVLWISLHPLAMAAMKAPLPSAQLAPWNRQPPSLSLFHLSVLCVTHLPSLGVSDLPGPPCLWLQ